MMERILGFAAAWIAALSMAGVSVSALVSIVDRQGVAEWFAAIGTVAAFFAVLYVRWRDREEIREATEYGLLLKISGAAAEYSKTMAEIHKKHKGLGDTYSPSARTFFEEAATAVSALPKEFTENAADAWAMRACAAEFVICLTQSRLAKGFAREALTELDTNGEKFEKHVKAAIAQVDQVMRAADALVWHCHRESIRRARKCVR